MSAKLCNRRLYRISTQGLVFISYHFSFCATRSRHMIPRIILKNHGGFHTYPLTYSAEKILSVHPCFAQKVSPIHMHKSSHCKLPQNSVRSSQNGTVSVQGRKHHYVHASQQNLTHTNLSHRAYTTGPDTVKETLVEWTAKLVAAEVPEANLAVEYIISHILDVPRVELHKHDSVRLSEDLLREVERLMTCRLLSFSAWQWIKVNMLQISPC